MLASLHAPLVLCQMAQNPHPGLMNICRILIQLRCMWPSVVTVVEMTSYHGVAAPFYTLKCETAHIFLTKHRRQSRYCRVQPSGPSCHHFSYFTHPNVVSASYYFLFFFINKGKYLFNNKSSWTNKRATICK